MTNDEAKKMPDYDEGLHKIVMKYCSGMMSMESCRNMEIEILTYNHILSECGKAVSRAALAPEPVDVDVCPFDADRLSSKAASMFGMIDTEQMWRTVKALRELNMSYQENPRNLIPPVEPVRGGAVEEIYRNGKEAINYLFRELQFCVDTRQTPAGYSQAHAQALDCLDRLGRAALSQAPAPDLDKIVERLEGLKFKQFVDLGSHVTTRAEAKSSFDAHNTAIDAAIEAVKQAGRG